MPELNFEQFFVVLLFISNVAVPGLVYYLINRGSARQSAQNEKERDLIFKWMERREKLWDNERERIVGKFFVKNAADYQLAMIQAKEHYAKITKPLDEWKEIDDESERARMDALRQLDEKMEMLKNEDDDVLQGD